MKRRTFLKAAGISAAATAVASPAIAQTLPTVTWRLQSSYPKSLDTLFGACVFMADAVSAWLGELVSGAPGVRSPSGTHHGGEHHDLSDDPASEASDGGQPVTAREA